MCRVPCSPKSKAISFARAIPPRRELSLAICNANNGLVGGNVQVDDNDGAFVMGNSVGGNVQVDNNSKVAVSVQANSVGGNMQVDDNSAGAVLKLNSVGGNVQVNNQWAPHFCCIRDGQRQPCVPRQHVAHEVSTTPCTAPRTAHRTAAPLVASHWRSRGRALLGKFSEAEHIETVPSPLSHRFPPLIIQHADEAPWKQDRTFATRRWRKAEFELAPVTASVQRFLQARR